MPALLSQVRDQIAADWVARVPSISGGRWGQALTDAVAEGASGHRAFRFDPPSFEEGHEDGVALRVFRWSFTATVAYTRLGLTTAALFDMIASDAVELTGAVNSRDAWPAGVLEVWSEAGEAQAIDGGETLELNLRFRAVVQEAY